VKSEEVETDTVTRFYQPDLSVNFDIPFIRDGVDKLIPSVLLALTNEEKRANLAGLFREHLIDRA